ncbi:MAG TPA: TetR/AcrR family transcriptional regulator [Streptosporangiaceae bacterium]|jgi:AcrR family transcriptional regulator|nr:TetR/AcrR family transcriptional regulator [Streptosporangiaceae bacterium]
MNDPRPDTRARIQQVAVELFTEHGYDGTSLREIAERLEVTKAALYYHFKSKEDIVASLMEDYASKMDALIAWGREQPADASTRRELLSRYVDIVAESGQVFRMLHQNQAAVSTLSSAKTRGELFKERVGSLINLLSEPDASAAARVKAAMAIGGISASWMFFSAQMDKGELSKAVRGIAADIVELPA